jgi:hypothetical protein
MQRVASYKMPLLMMDMLPGATFTPREGHAGTDRGLIYHAHCWPGPNRSIRHHRRERPRALAENHPDIGAKRRNLDVRELFKSSARMTTSEMNPSA